MTNHKGEEDFRKYRDIAPEGVDDETILSLIQKSAGSHTAITAAIENMWHDLPDGKAVGGLDEWNTTSKSKSKKDVISAQQDRGGRGGRGGSQSGGRGQGAGGRGAGDRGIGRGPGAPSAGRGASVPRSAAAAPQQSHQSTARVAVTEQSAVTASAAPLAVSAAPSAPISSGGSSGWGSGGTTLAEKLKQAEIQKLSPPVVIHQEVVEESEAPAVEPIPAVPSVESHGDRGHRRPRGRGSGHPPAAAAVVEAKTEVAISAEGAAVQEHVHELIEEVLVMSVSKPAVEIELPVEATTAVSAAVPVAVTEPAAVEHVREREPMAAPVQEMAPVAAPKAFLKMGKWEAPLESSAFQFGSFGSYSTATNDEAISLSAKATWGAVAESTDLAQQKVQSEVAAVWGANGTSVSDPSSSSSGASPISSLFPAPKGLPSDASPSGSSSSSQSQNGRYDQQKPLVPPGLEAHHSISKPVPRQDSRSAAPGQNQNRVKYDAAQQQQLQQQQQYQQPQYQQQAAATPPATSRSQAPATSSMMYAYAPGFDVQSQYQQPSYGQPAPTAVTPAAGSSPVTTAGTPTTQTQGQESAPGAPQGLQYGPPPGMANHYVNPYYGSPYYGSQYFYGQPIAPNPYYAQGRGDFQSQGRYGDPYAAAGQYPNVYHQGAGFDPMAMQQHLSMSQQSHGQGQSGAPATATPAASQGKQQKGASAAAAAPQQQDPNQGYTYNPYNPRDGQWGYQGWNAPMMGFPGGSPTNPGGPQGFAQQPLQQQQQPGQGQRPSSTGYGASAQGQQQQQQQPFPRGAAANAPASSGNSTGQHW